MGLVWAASRGTKPNANETATMESSGMGRFMLSHIMRPGPFVRFSGIAKMKDRQTGTLSRKVGQEEGIWTKLDEPGQSLRQRELRVVLFQGKADKLKR
jgi:hypothetical protein